MELLPNQYTFLDQVNSLGIPGVCVNKQLSTKCGIRGTHIRVMVDGEEEESLDVHVF